MTLASCASAPIAQQFTPPSLAPAEQAVARVEQHVSGAQGDAKKLADATDSASKNTKAWQDAYNQLTQELTNAYLQVQSAQEELKAKQVEVDTQTADANKIVVERNSAVNKLQAAQDRGNAWMKRSLILGGILGLEVLAVGGFFALKFGLL